MGGGSTKFVLSDRLIVYTKSIKQLLHRKYLLYETGCISIVSNVFLQCLNVSGLISSKLLFFSDSVLKSGILTGFFTTIHYNVFLAYLSRLCIK